MQQFRLVSNCVSHSLRSLRPRYTPAGIRQTGGRAVVIQCVRAAFCDATPRRRAWPVGRCRQAPAGTCPVPILPGKILGFPREAPAIEGKGSTGAGLGFL
jgi:hypothetical protein